MKRATGVQSPTGSSGVMLSSPPLQKGMRRLSSLFRFLPDSIVAFDAATRGHPPVVPFHPHQFFGHAGYKCPASVQNFSTLILFPHRSTSSSTASLASASVASVRIRKSASVSDTERTFSNGVFRRSLDGDTHVRHTKIVT